MLPGGHCSGVICTGRRCVYQGSVLLSVRGVLRDAAAHGDREHALSAVRNLQKAGVAAVQDWSDRVQALVKTGNVHRAVSYLSGLVERGHQPNINAFHFVLEPLSRKRILSTSLIVVALMRQCGTPLDTKAYHYALGACGGQHAMQHADQLLREMKAAGVAADQHTFAAAAHACIVSKKWQRALDLFAEIEADYPHLVTVGMWNRLLRVLIRTGQPEQAIAKGAEMVERGLKLNSETFSYLLGAHARLADQTQITALTSAVRAAGVRVTHACRFQIIEGYALTGHLQLAEEALEAAVQSGQARPDMIMAIVSGCRLVGDASRAQRWLQRSLSLGLTPSAATWHMAIETAQEGGDEGAADALWHDAEAAGALSFYKVMRRNKEGVLIVDLDRTSVLRQPLKSALDVSRCNVVLAHAALRAAARELAQMPPPAIRYICTGAFNPKQHAAAKALAEIMQDAGAQVSREAGTGGLWKVTMPRRTR
ncbi:hypothetical protein JKP88DRAFT_333160 [Tribonema minus]|uniref:Pentatricopeptide repeat-containing protein-mitochondrial domain-containing protein n=1 Tax=Tribonema minus TaxID=303371 RepID=A0A835YPB5_9STRA|nr:hypothetical protein JKP88DRAFT_333160 [Tribonema minus]